MDVAERILNEMNTPEGKEKLKKWADEYRARLDERNLKIQEMFANSEYIDWLSRFTLENQNFSDDMWLYFPEKISKEDGSRVDDLCLMYEGIDKYASENYIFPYHCDFGNFYKIKFNDVGFEIGTLSGQGTIFFCSRVSIEDEKEFIDFNDIINNKKSDNVTTIENSLSELSEHVISLSNNGVPLEAITNTLNSTLSKLHLEKEVSKVKVLK